MNNTEKQQDFLLFAQNAFNYKALSKFVQKLQEEAYKNRPENLVQFECLIEETLENFRKTETRAVGEDFRDAVYRVTDSMNLSMHIVPNVEVIVNSYQEEFRPNNWSIVLGLLCSGSVINSIYKERSMTKAQFLQAAGLAYDMQVMSDRVSREQTKEIPKWLN